MLGSLLRVAKDHDLELIYLNGQYEATQVAPEIKEFFPDQVYRSHFTKVPGGEYKDLALSLSYVAGKMIELGPIHGLLGFSQGANVAASLCAILTNNPSLLQLPETPPCPQFVVLMGAVKSNWADEFQRIASAERPIAIRSLHVIGERDHYRERSEMVVELFDPTSRSVVYHPENHRPFPGDFKAATRAASTVRDFMFEGQEQAN